MVEAGESSKQGQDPLDAQYEQLLADLTVLASDDPLMTLISSYVKNTLSSSSIKLRDVWAVRRHSEDSSFAQFAALDNHRLLWHGTNIAAVAAIVRTGLRIMPSVNGGRVGRGIYMANLLDKSASYVRPTRLADGSNLGVLFLVEAALGRMHEIYRYNYACDRSYELYFSRYNH